MPFDLLGPVAARREDQDGKDAGVGAPFLEHRETVETRQAEIEDGDVVVLDVALEPRVFAVLGEIDDEARGLKRADDVRSDIGIVFDNQRPHLG